MFREEKGIFCKFIAVRTVQQKMLIVVIIQCSKYCRSFYMGSVLHLETFVELDGVLTGKFLWFLSWHGPNMHEIDHPM